MQGTTRGTKSRTTKRGKTAGSNDELVPEYIRRWRRGREEALDFEKLRSELQELARRVEPMAIPSAEQWEAMIARRAVNVTWEHEALFWALHDYPGAEDYRERIEELNDHIENSGLPDLAAGRVVAENSWAGVVLRAIEKGKASQGLFDAWAQLHHLSGRRLELLLLQESARKATERNQLAGACSSTLAQHVWYARWLLRHVRNSDEDREDVIAKFIDLVDSVVQGRRASPDEKRWPPSWFEKLLQKRQKSKLVTIGGSGPVLIDRLTRLSDNQLRGLAEKSFITASLLPPLDHGEFPKRSSRP